MDPNTDSKRVVEIARCQRTGLLLIDLDNFALDESLGKKIPKGARGHIKAQPYESFAFAVSRAASSGAMAGRQLTSTERIMGLSPSDAATACGGSYPTVMLISSGFREHFGGPNVSDREFWMDRSGNTGGRFSDGRGIPSTWEIEPSTYGTFASIMMCNSGTTLGVTGTSCAASSGCHHRGDYNSTALPSGDCGDIVIIGACTAARHHSVSWTTILAIIFEYYGVPYVFIHQGIGGWHTLSCAGRGDCCRILPENMASVTRFVLDHVQGLPTPGLMHSDARTVPLRTRPTLKSRGAATLPQQRCNEAQSTPGR